MGIEENTSMTYYLCDRLYVFVVQNDGNAGELMKMLAGPTRLNPQDQKLIYIYIYIYI